MKSSGSIVDGSGRRWFSFEDGKSEGGKFIAKARVICAPEDVLAIFREYYEHVSNHELSLLDDLTSRIDAYGPKVMWENEDRQYTIQDLEFASGFCLFKIA